MNLSNQQNIKVDQIVILPINKTQNYAWGCKDKNCLVGLMTKQNLETYAQFWMGTHPNGESKLANQKSLKQYLNDNGIKQIEFLFKILSIQKCLSIQAHPNQQQAKELHKNFPQIYVDDRDKPEMFLTLSDKFQLFLGFVDEKELQFLLTIQPFKSFGSQIQQADYQRKILYLLEKLVHLSEAQLKQKIETLFNNLNHFTEQRQNILKRIYDQFQIDSGILVSCLLQYHILQAGSCFGIQAGVPHAYIKGECFELMKNSDNVVRLGLTPKKKDIPNLLKIIKNNFDRKYSKIEGKRDSLAQKFEWKQYSIIQLLLENQENQVELLSDSIGITLNGQGFISRPSSQNNQIYIPQKTVVFLQKGIYRFRGNGQIFIASKAS